MEGALILPNYGSGTVTGLFLTRNGVFALKKKAPVAPKTLSTEARAWWRELVGEFDVSDPAGRLLLQTGLEAFQRMREAQAVIAEQGLTMPDRFGQQKAHPATVVERDSRAGMLAALRQLNLDIEPSHDRPGRPAGS